MATASSVAQQETSSQKCLLQLLLLVLHLHLLSQFLVLIMLHWNDSFCLSSPPSLSSIEAGVNLWVFEVLFPMFPSLWFLIQSFFHCFHLLLHTHLVRILLSTHTLFYVLFPLSEAGPSSLEPSSEAIGFIFALSGISFSSSLLLSAWKSASISLQLFYKEIWTPGDPSSASFIFGIW